MRSHAERGNEVLFLAGNQFVLTRYGNSQLGDLLIQLIDERIKLGNFAGILTLLVLAEAVKVSLVLWPPAMKKEAILGNDRLAELFHLIEFRAVGQCPLSSANLENFSPFNSE